MKKNQLLYQANLDLEEFAQVNSNKFNSAEPFPHIHIENFFSNDVLSNVLREFPDLSRGKKYLRKNNYQVGKYYTGNEECFGEITLQLLNYLTSMQWLDFLQKLSSIKEKLIGDPYYFGGGLHETKRGGQLKIHSDFKKHPDYNLDRRLNLLIFLNNDWKKSFCGNLELWDKHMKKCVKSFSPQFNSMVIFKTTDFSNHGYPDPILCPEYISRKSIALYYYTCGRPDKDINYKVRQDSAKTYWKARKNNKRDKLEFNIKYSWYSLFTNLVRKILPNKLFKLFHKITNSTDNK